jgi:hypothetical protein
MEMTRKRKLFLTGAAALGVAVGAAGIAGAATTGSSTGTSSSSSTSASAAAPTRQDPATVSHGPGETLLTGTTAEKVTAAAKAAEPGATIIRAETDSEGAAYEAHMKKADGTYITLKFDSSFKVTSTDDGFGGGPGGHGGPGGPGMGAGYGSSSSGNATTG